MAGAAEWRWSEPSSTCGPSKLELSPGSSGIYQRQQALKAVGLEE